MIRTLTALFLILSISACQTPPKTLTERYMLAVEDASIVTPNEISHNLIPILPNNPNLHWDSSKTRLKVVTWKSSQSYDKFIKNNTNTNPAEDYVIWVTTAPQVQKFCQAYMRDNPGTTLDALNLRLKQYLGISPDLKLKYDVFVELWVNQNDLFRPCVDPEIHDSTCDLKFGEQSKPIPEVSNISNYKSFYQNLYFNDFRYRQSNDTKTGTPWTGLGYTYDWGNPNTPVGASEFIIVPNAPYTIAAAIPTKEYCRVQ